MSYYLFLDDYRYPGDVNWVNIPKQSYIIVRSYDEFKSCITERGLPEYVSFDHDLEARHYEGDYSTPTGLECAMFLVDFCKRNGYTIPKYGCHSMNPEGVYRICSYMERNRNG